MTAEEVAISHRREDRAEIAVLQEQVKNLSIDVSIMIVEMRQMHAILDQQLGGMRVLRGLFFVLGALASAGLSGWLLGVLRGHH